MISEIENNSTTFNLIILILFDELNFINTYI